MGIWQKWGGGSSFHGIGNDVILSEQESLANWEISLSHFIVRPLTKHLYVCDASAKHSLNLPEWEGGSKVYPRTGNKDILTETNCCSRSELVWYLRP